MRDILLSEAYTVLFQKFKPLDHSKLSIFYKYVISIALNISFKTLYRLYPTRCVKGTEKFAGFWAVLDNLEDINSKLTTTNLSCVDP